jgi:tRNA uridine 5-carboxymethylaminomethyl modification enzyme
MTNEEIKRIKNTNIAPTQKVQEYLSKNNSTLLKSGIKLDELLKRPELNYESLAEIDELRPELPVLVQQQAEVQIKYEGYIKRQMEQVEQFQKLEKRLLLEEFDYTTIKGLRLEAQQKLNKIRPMSIGQASRISGVSPADISVLLVYLESLKRANAKENN